MRFLRGVEKNGAHNRHEKGGPRPTVGSHRPFANTLQPFDGRAWGRGARLGFNEARGLTKLGLEGRAGCRFNVGLDRREGFGFGPARRAHPALPPRISQNPARTAVPEGSPTVSTAPRPGIFHSRTSNLAPKILFGRMVRNRRESGPTGGAQFSLYGQWACAGPRKC